MFHSCPINYRWSGAFGVDRVTTAGWFYDFIISTRRNLNVNKQAAWSFEMANSIPTVDRSPFFISTEDNQDGKKMVWGWSPKPALSTVSSKLWTAGSPKNCSAKPSSSPRHSTDTQMMRRNSLILAWGRAHLFVLDTAGSLRTWQTRTSMCSCSHLAPTSMSTLKTHLNSSVYICSFCWRGIERSIFPFERNRLAHWEHFKRVLMSPYQLSQNIQQW